MEEPLINNPAGRLYLLLGRLRAIEGPVGIGAAWASVLDVPEEMVEAHIGKVALLVSQIEEAVAVPGRERIATAVNRYRTDWLRAALPLHVGFNQQVHKIKPSDESYEALGLVADYLLAVASVGSVPSEEEQADRLKELQALIEDVRAAEELPERVRHLILDRLSAVEAALQHINIEGPEGVQHALEALLGAAFATTVTNERTAKSKIIRRVMGTAGVIWVMFTSGPTAQKSLDAWTEMFHELPAGPAQTQPAAHDLRMNADGAQPASGYDQPAATPHGTKHEPSSSMDTLGP